MAENGMPNIDDISAKVDQYLSEAYFNENAPKAAVAGGLAAVGAYFLMDSWNLQKTRDVVDDAVTIAIYDNLRDIVSVKADGLSANMGLAISAGLPILTDLGNTVASSVVVADPSDPTKWDPTSKLLIAGVIGLFTAFAVYVKA